MPYRLDPAQNSAARTRMEQRTSREAKALIERAARAVGLNASEFTIAAACRAARETLQHQEITELSRDDVSAFMVALDASEPSVALVDLLRLRPPAS